MTGHHHHHHHHRINSLIPQRHYRYTTATSPRLHRNTSATPLQQPRHHRYITATPPVPSSHTFGLQPIPFGSPLGPHMGYFYYQTGIGQQNCHTPTSAQLMAEPQQTHFSSTATPHPAQLQAQHARFPVQLPMFPPAVPQAQFASPQGGSFYDQGNYAYMLNAFQSQATMLLQALQTMTPQDPFWNMDAGASSHLADNTGIRSLARMEEAVVSAPVQECLDMEPKKRKNYRRKLKMKRNSNLASLDKREDTENPNTTIGAIASVYQEMIVTSPAADGDGKNVISSTDAPDKTASRVICSPAAIVDQQMTVLTIGEILTPQNLQSLKTDNAETGSGTTAADTTASKKRKRGKKKKKSPLSGDILSTSENIQDKVNAIDGLSTTKALDTKVTNTMELSDITNHNVDDKKGPEVVNSEIVASNRTSKQKTKKHKVDVTQGTPVKKLIIFEVNGMLADIVFPCPKDVKADKYSHGVAVFKRPYLDDFLSFCFEKFNVGIWSSRMKINLNLVVHCLFGDLKKKLLFTWDASLSRNSGMRTLEETDKCIVFKKLRKIWEKSGSWVKGTFNESNTLLLDDSPYKALLNPKHTGIFPTSYKYTDTNDDCLGPTGSLRAYLEGFAAAEDGRTYVEQNPFGQGPIDEMNRDWKYYSRVLKGQKLVTEAISGEMVLGKTALPDVKMVSKEEKHTEAANGKMGSSATDNLNVKGAVNSCLTIGEILTPRNLQNLKAGNGETGSGTTAADTTASKKRKRGKKKKKSPLSGDILSTCENIQDKVNAIDGLSTTRVLFTKVTNKMELTDITNHNVDGKKGPEVVASEIGASNTTSKQKTKKQKVGVDPSEIIEITQATLGKKLIIFDVNGMLADIVFSRSKDVEADNYSHGKAVFKRPFLDDFLSFCFEKFNVCIWSSRMKKNLDPVVDCLFGDLKKKLLFIWDASHCRNSGMRSPEDRYKCNVCKELIKIWEKNCRSWVKGTFNGSNTLLLDDSPYKALLNPKHTGIFPTSYKYGDTNDDCLGFNMEIWHKFVNELHELLLNSDWDQLSMGTDIVCMECGKDMVPELREKGIRMNKENFGTYEAMDSYAREYDIAGAKGKECGWIYE